MSQVRVFDFGKIEALRKHLGLRQQDMAELFGISRVQYCKWVRDFKAGEPKKMYETTARRVRDSLDNLVWLIRHTDWPNGTDSLGAALKFEALKAKLAQRP